MPATHRTPTIVETVPRQRRSVFGNYTSTADPGAATDGTGLAQHAESGAPAGGCADLALARSFLHQFLARAFDYPMVEAWRWLTTPSIQQGVALAAAALEPEVQGPLQRAQQTLVTACVPVAFDRFHDDYVAAIGHAARGSCPVNEIEYGDLKADPLFQPHRLADLAAFYRAFGVELGASADERHDHLAVELEFMAVLAAQEASLLNQAPASEPLSVCRDAQRKFLREHLGRWTPAFARRLDRAVGGGPLGALAAFTLAFIESECRRFAVTPGSEELLLRPTDATASLCDGCGLTQALPGAVSCPTPA